MPKPTAPDYEDLEHAKALAADLYYLSHKDSKHNLRMVHSFTRLLELAVEIVNTNTTEGYDDQQRAIEELEEFLR